jgi:hypothetical protein
LEPSRTNLFPYSEYIANYSPAFGGVIEYDSTIQTPQGVNGCYTFYDSDGGAYARIRHNLGGFSIGDKHSHSVFIKGTPNSRMLLGDEYGGGTNEFDLSTKTLVSQGANVESYKIEDYGNGWTRYSVVSVFQDAIGNGNVYSLIRVSGDSSNKVPLWGWQLEEGSYPTSYIPNHSGGTITRGADECNGAGDSSTFNVDEGVFYAEISTNTDDTDKAISLTNNIGDRLWMGYSTANKNVYALGYVNYSIQFALSKSITDESLFVKIACKYAENDVSFFVNGEKVGTDTSALAFTELDSLDFDLGTNTGNGSFYGNVKQILVFNEALSDADCIAITS